MSIKDELLQELLAQVEESTAIEGKAFKSRFELRPYDIPGVIGIGLEEVDPSLRERDRHLMHAKRMGWLEFKTKSFSDHEDYDGAPIHITEKGREWLGSKPGNLTLLGSAWGRFTGNFVWPLLVLVVGGVILAALGIAP